MPELRSEKGTYLLIFKANQGFQCQVGKLGKIEGPAGYYSYVGSARGPGGIAARVKHHLKIASKPHWHLDYVRPCLQPVEIWCNYATVSLEHQWAQTLLHFSKALSPLSGFGASDCQCKSHLVYFEKVPVLSVFKKLLQRYGSANPRGEADADVIIERIRY